MLQDNYIFTHIHFMQKEGWQLVKKLIITHTNFFSSQQEQKGIISPNNRITVTSLLYQLNAKNLTKSIIKEKDQMKIKNSTFLIKNLKIQNIFKDKDDKKGNNVIDELIVKVL